MKTFRDLKNSWSPPFASFATFVATLCWCAVWKISFADFSCIELQPPPRRGCLRKEYICVKPKRLAPRKNGPIAAEENSLAGFFQLHSQHEVTHSYIHIIMHYYSILIFYYSNGYLSHSLLISSIFMGFEQCILLKKCLSCYLLYFI